MPAYLMKKKLYLEKQLNYLYDAQPSPSFKSGAVEEKENKPVKSKRKSRLTHIWSDGDEEI